MTKLISKCCNNKKRKIKFIKLKMVQWMVLLIWCSLSTIADLYNDVEIRIIRVHTRFSPHNPSLLLRSNTIYRLGRACGAFARVRQRKIKPFRPIPNNLSIMWFGVVPPFLALQNWTGNLDWKKRVQYHQGFVFESSFRSTGRILYMNQHPLGH